MIELIFGKRGSGKTTHAKARIKQYKNTLVIDPLQEYAGLIFYDVDMLLEHYEKKGVFNCVFRPIDDNELNLVFDLYKLGDFTYLVEEIDMLVTSSYIPPNLEYIIKYGRHYDINIVGICRRVQETSRLLTSQANKIWTSRMQEPADVLYFKKLGFNETELKSLPEHQFICRDF